MTQAPTSLEDLRRRRERAANRTALQSMPRYTPSPEEIREACREIQSRWTEAIREQRRVIQACPFILPECKGPHNGY